MPFSSFLPERLKRTSLMPTRLFGMSLNIEKKKLSASNPMTMVTQCAMRISSIR